MKFDLAALVRRTRNPRRATIILRDIVPPAVLATNLYRSTYLPIARLWERRTERIVAEYERTLSSMTHDSPASVQAEIDAGESEFLRLFFELVANLRDFMLRTEKWQRSRWSAAVLSASGVALDTIIGPEDVRDTLETYIAWNTDLIRDVNDQTRRRIANSVFSGLNQRKPAREVAAEIREATGMARDRSQRIASDQLSKITSSLAAERRRQAGIEKWKWRHSGKLHPRADHVARNGKVYTDETAPKDTPGQLPFCGCRELAVIDLD